MRAVVITRVGSPDVLEIQERNLPTPGPAQVRVRERTSPARWQPATQAETAAV